MKAFFLVETVFCFVLFLIALQFFFPPPENTIVVDGILSG